MSFPVLQGEKRKNVEEIRKNNKFFFAEKIFLFSSNIEISAYSISFKLGGGCNVQLRVILFRGVRPDQSEGFFQNPVSFFHANPIKLHSSSVLFAPSKRRAEKNG